ncbi:MAG: S-layer homology domain-containing protein [Anaerovoracaceae bacterium]|jgi:hypothetical protein
MRKVLSFVLVLSLVLGSFGMAFAAPLSDMAGEKSEDAVKVLTELGVVNGYPDGTYKPGNIVTRAEMAVIVVSALGLADYAIGTSNYSDMGGHWSNGFVAYATSLGIISGYPDKTFKPDKTVSYDEAATMLVAALGYTPDSLVGTWPANFVTKAKTLGILDGIKAGAAGANRGDIAIMAYQTLDQQIGKTNKDGDWVVTNSGTVTDPVYDTMLERLGAVLYTPTVDKDAKAGDAFVVTGDEETVINLRPFLGAYVTAYANDDDEIIAIKEVKSVYIRGNFVDAVDDEGTIAKNADFEGTDKDYSFKDAVDMDDLVFFENGDNVKAFDLDDETEYTLAVKISGNKISDLYSVSAWVRTDDFLYEKDMLEDDNLDGHDFALDDNDDIDLAAFELLGIASLDDLKVDNVVYVYVNDDDEIARIAVGTEVITGEVTKINSSGKKITVEGKVYEMYDGSVFSAKLEDDVELRLDYFGDVYDIDKAGGSLDDYAVLLQTGNGDTSLSGKDGSVKLFLADGSDKVFTIDNDLVVKVGATVVLDENGQWQGDYALDNGKKMAGTLVEYGLDKDGVIDSLEIISVTTTSDDEQEITSKGYFDGKAVDSGVLIFAYDGADTVAARANDDNYGVTTFEKVKGNDYKGVIYHVDSSSKKIDVMLIPGEGTGDDEVYGLSTGWSKTTASSTDYMGTFLVDGKAVEYELTSAGKNAVADASEELVYLLKFNASDQVSNLVEVKTTATAGMDGIILKEKKKITAEYANSIVAVDGTSYTVASDAVAYEWDVKDEEYDKVSISKSKLKKDVYVSVYDLDKDGVVDIILINENFAPAP